MQQNINELKDFPITVQQKLIWGDMDAYGHVNNTVYFRYFEDARMAYFEQVGVNDYMDKHNIGPILASTSADYKAPLVYPDDISVTARISEVQAKKIFMQYRVYSHTQKKVVASGSGLVIYFNYTLKQTCHVPDTIAAHIKQLEETKGR